MSRYVIELEGNREFVYGFDHTLRYFYQLWDNNLGDEDEECLIADKSYLFDKLSKDEMVEMMSKYNANKEHIFLIAMDLPF
jgi:hypothetical protein